MSVSFTLGPSAGIDRAFASPCEARKATEASTARIVKPSNFSWIPVINVEEYALR